LRSRHLGRRAARKLATDPRGFVALVADRLARNLRTFTADPVESGFLLRERIGDRRELRAKRQQGGGVMPWPPCPYAVDEDWERRLHEIAGAPWPCSAQDEFWHLWSLAMNDLETRRGLQFGRGAFGGWGDGEPGLVRAVWCLACHLQPEKVVETGVGRGITTRFLLQALERNGSGHLWSVDLPPLERDLQDQIAIAVPDGLRDRWTYVRGSSRRRLPRLLAQIAPIDLFIHDSMHTSRNLLFELHSAWGASASNGVLVADDVDMNCGFHVFRNGHSDHASLVCHAEPLQPDHPRQDARGVFAVVQRADNERGPR
jgi:hypothetical protein